MRKTVTVLAAGALALGAGSMLAACGDDAAEEAIEQATGGDVDIDPDDGSVGFENEEGSASFGSCDELPDEFPSDVPTPDATPTGCSQLEAEGVSNWTLVYDTDDADKIDAYKSTLEDDGFDISGEASYEAGGSSYETFSATRGTYLVNVGGGAGVGDSGDGLGSGIFVNVTDDPDAQ